MNDRPPNSNRLSKNNKSQAHIQLIQQQLRAILSKPQNPDITHKCITLFGHLYQVLKNSNR